MTTSREQYIYISSINKHSGDPYDFDMIFDEGLISCKENEQLRISLVKVSMDLTLNQVNTLNNQISFFNTTTSSVSRVSIPTGNYTVYDLALYVRNAYPSILSLKFSKSYNHFIFTFSQPHIITFIDNANVVFGFSQKTTTSSTIIESDIPCKPNTINDIVLNIYGVSPISHNLDNFATNSCKLSNIIGMLQIEDIPFGVLRYNNITGEFATTINEKSIKKLRFVMTDINNKVLDYCNLPEYTMVIRVSIDNKKDDILQTLKDLKEYSRLTFLHNTMG